MDNFLTPLLFVALLIGVTAAPLGCLIVWRRMAYFGDALAHTALLGVALGVVFGINVYLGGALVCAGFAFLLVNLQRRRTLSMDTLLGILAHGGLALGILALALVPQQNANDARGGHESFHAMEEYLFGDLAQITAADMVVIIPVCLLVLAGLKKYWHALILMTLSEDLARAEGLNTTRLHIILMLMLTLIVALAIKTTGVLFITSLLIIPAAAARQLSRTPRQMTLWAMVLAFIAVLVGITLAATLNMPSGPMTIGVASAIFILSMGVGSFIRRQSPRL